jgi:recombination associated protein RdgC
MDTKLFKNFTVYVNRAGSAPTLLPQMQSQFSKYPVFDPTGSQWTTGGFAPITAGDEPEYVIDIQGAAMLALIQVNERILPGSVQREKIIERIAQIEAREQRKPNKKDYAQVKDEVCQELLPKAFIRRTLIPIMFINHAEFGQLVLVFTSSAKKADDVMVSLGVALNGKHWSPARLDNIVVKDATTVLTGIAKGNTVEAEVGGEDMTLEFHNAAVLKGPAKQSIRIKDKDIGSADVQNLLKQDYSVTRLGLQFYDDLGGDPSAVFQLTDKMVFNGLKVDAVSKERTDSEADSTAMFINNTWLIARAARDLVGAVIVGMGGLRVIEEAADPEVGSQDTPAKISTGNLLPAQESIIADPLQRTYFDERSPFVSTADEDDEL